MNQPTTELTAQQLAERAALKIGELAISTRFVASEDMENIILEQTQLESLVECAEALRVIHNLQDGPQRLQDLKQWTDAMDKAQHALNALGGGE